MTMPRTLNLDDSSWDPMTEDYENPRYNSYVQSQGVQLDNRKEVNLRVQRIQSSMEDQGILNIFRKYGKVKITYRGPSKTDRDVRENLHIAFLEIENLTSANRAIEGINGTPPLYLKVSIALPKDHRNRSNQNIIDFDGPGGELAQIMPAPDPDQTEPDNIYEGPKLEEIQESFFSSDSDRYSKAFTNDNFDPAYCNMHVDFLANKGKIYTILDKIYSKECETANKKVSLGRWYYSLKKENDSVATKPNSFKFNQKAEMSDRGRCIACNKPGSMSCPVCDSFYCSRRCQLQDWPQHKSVCLDLAPTKNTRGSTTLVSLKVTHVAEGFIYAIRTDHLDKFDSFQKRLQELSPSEHRFGRPMKGFKCAVLSEERKEWCRGIFVEISPLLIFFMDYGFSSPCTGSLIHRLHAELSAEQSFALKLTFPDQSVAEISPGTTIKVSSLKTKQDFYEAELRERESDQPKSVCSSIRSIRQADFFGNIPVKILDLSPDVFTEVCIKAKLSATTYFVSCEGLSASEQCKSMNGYVAIADDGCRVVLPVGTKIRIRPVCRLASDFFRVETDSHLSEMRLGDDTERANPQSSMTWFQENDKGELVILNVQRNDSFFAMSLTNENKKIACELFRNFRETSKKLPQHNDFVPEIGDCVAAKVEYLNEWTRGIVWSISGSSFVRIVLIDVGCVVSVPLKDVRPLGKKYKSYPPIIVYCKIVSKSNEYFKPKETFDFVVRKEAPDSNRVTCVLMNGKKEICLLEVSDWDPTAEDVGLKAVEIKSRTEVKLSQFYSSSLLYVTPINNANFMIGQKLAKLVQSSKPLKEREPRFGELVAVKWNKNNQYYRAQILEPINNDEYRIFFVDSGTQEVGNMADVYELDDELKSYPCLAVKVSLKNIDNTEIPNPKAVIYLNSLGIKEERLKILFENDDLSSVELLHSNNETVNDKLNQRLKTDDVAFNDEIYCDDVVYTKLEIDAELELGLLRMANGGVFMLEPKSDEAQFVFGTFQKLINEYCDNLKNNGYNPHDEEVVFARINTRDSENCWCRAVVIKSPHLRSHVVQCLDYGGQGDILTTSLRKMHPKFMLVPAVGLSITLKRPDRLDPSPKENMYSYLKPLSTYPCKVLTGDDFEYAVVMKHVNDIS